MKTRLSNPAVKSPRRGFTLIEVLIVISIMAFLMASAWVARNYFIARGLTKTAETQLALLQAGVEAYKADSGGVLPYGSGDEWSSHVLYSMLSGDTSNNGKPNKNSKTGQMNTAYIKDLVYIKSGAKETTEGILVTKKPIAKSRDSGTQRAGSRYVILDPWGNPVRYRLGCEAETKGSKEGPGINADFDIYSLGADGLGDARNKEGDNVDNVTNIQTL